MSTNRRAVQGKSIDFAQCAIFRFYAKVIQGLDPNPIGNFQNHREEKNTSKNRRAVQGKSIDFAQSAKSGFLNMIF